MKKQIWVLVAGIFLVLASGMLVIGLNRANGANTTLKTMIDSFQKKDPPQTLVVEEWKSKGTNQYELNHQQEVWLSALEWCESNGLQQKAINPKDLDNSPSYYAWQFKPGTFELYAVKYKLLPDNLEYEDYFNWMSDYDLNKEVMIRMIGDKSIPDSQWRKTLFPGCIKKLGVPPKE